MAHASIKALAIAALAGTSLSGCSIIGSAAGGVWSGTKSVANVATYPVRMVLRDAPETETEFAAVEVETTTIEGDTTTTTKTVEIVETVQVSTTESYDIVTVDSASFLQLNGQGSLEDWRTCEVRSNGYWIYDETSQAGLLNPKFESCMLGMDYRLETELSDEMLALLQHRSDQTSTVVLLADSTAAALDIETLSSVDNAKDTEMMMDNIVHVEMTTVMVDSAVTQPMMTSTKTSGGILETVQVSATKSYDIVTVDDVLFIRLNGEASMKEWRDCEVRTNGYWVFDETSLVGSLNPEFASCMKGLDYTLETQLGDALPAAFLANNADAPVTTETAELATDIQPLP